ncbi:N-acetylglucosamine-6-phosphate deacetylase [Blastococcus haudaquaticus]|uniref:N-acetylglucosamine 6-phosphate deacetylase n=1 Tax=Blastococcus haudaquaticus TaxID=1938745 RepID=A0A286GXR8_9ACTN|nr:N-acetylglucosamine-6-phosphate deacetylase [Blastococcus haudaquaticus]SOE00281.1 N-acetylglucosamine 6-phosphate deacetylase [Blastococcus haudaquaticus]
MTVLLHGARVLDAAGIVADGWVLFDGPLIAATGTGEPPPADRAVDLAGAWLTPGFVDLHLHGGGGSAFDDGTASIVAALRTHRAHGTTRSVVSLVANPLEVLEARLDEIAGLTGTHGVLGAHLEGPFLAPSRCGAHDPRFLRTPAVADVDRLLDAARGTLRQLTVAPELPGAVAAIEQLAAAGVTVAVGHTEADLATTGRAFDAGARLLTHAFNAMPGLHHRAPGPVLAAVADERVTLEVVLDGVHVHPGLVALLAAGAPGRIALVSDAMAAAGTGDGSYALGGLRVDVRDGRAVLEGTGTIAGSTLTLDTALRLAVDVAGLDPVTTVTALTATPARAIGLGNRFGRLAPGYAADAVVLGDDWSVRAVWADGEPVPR